MKYLFNFIISKTLLKIIEAFLIHNLLIKINAFVIDKSLLNYQSQCSTLRVQLIFKDKSNFILYNSLHSFIFPILSNFKNN
jgi:hypothetical protein